MREKQSSKLKVRFHLAKGHNFMKWQIKGSENVDYYKPEDVSLMIVNAKLVNQKSAAKKILEGASKTVCAWVECEDVLVIPKVMSDMIESRRIKFNPKCIDHWTDSNGDNVDGSTYKLLTTKNRNIYVF